MFIFKNLFKYFCKLNSAKEAGEKGVHIQNCNTYWQITLEKVMLVYTLTRSV